MEKDLEKYQAKVNILHYQAKIDQAVKIIEHDRVQLDKLEKMVEPVRLELNAAIEVSTVSSWEFGKASADLWNRTPTKPRLRMIPSS